MSPLQYKIYTFIRDYLLQHAYSPSYTEIAKGVGMNLNSKSLISRSLHILVNNGHLLREEKGYRNIRLPLSRYQLPIIGKIAAGKPIEPIEQHAVLDLADLLCKKDCYVLEVKGDSMIGEGIWSGDKIICKRQSTAAEGDIAVVLIDGEKATLKQIRYQPDGKILLAAANPDYSPQVYEASRIVIQGIFIGLLRLPAEKTMDIKKTVMPTEKTTADQES